MLDERDAREPGMKHCYFCEGCEQRISEAVIGSGPGKNRKLTGSRIGTEDLH
jgi:hypothetical protein